MKRGVVQAIKEVLHLLHAGICITLERAVTCCLAIFHPVTQRGLEASHLHGGELIAADRGIKCTVEDHVTDISGELLGVGGAQEGSVGVAQVVELLLPKQRANHIEVFRCIHGVDVLEDVTTEVLAALGEISRSILCELDHFCGTCIRIDRVSRSSGVAVTLFISSATDRG